MDADTADKILSQVAKDGSMDYAVWPELLPVVLERIEKIAHTEFRIPNIPTPTPPPRPPSPRFIAPLPSSDPAEGPDRTGTPSSQGTDKENADPTLVRRPSAAPATEAPSQQQSSASSTLPKPIADMLDEVLNVLRTGFPRYPPHTIQRLAELVLKPRQHYRNLVPWLHALDRVVHVTSGANIYPLPQGLPDIGAMSLLVNGADGAGPGGMSIDTASANNLDSDEALGGALLTPIPWLSRTVNGDGSDVDDDPEASDEAGSNNSSGSNSNASALTQQQQRQQAQLHLQQRQLEGRVQTESTETIEGPNGMGSIETVSVSVNGIPSTGATVASFLGMAPRSSNSILSQALPQQQRQRPPQPQQRQQGQTNDDEDTAMKDGPDSDPTSTPGGTTNDNSTDAGEATPASEEEEEIPHARGPAEIGPADTGPLSPAVAELIASRSASVSGSSSVAGSTKRSVSPDPSADRVPPSPKREAEDSLESGAPAKRRRGGEEGEEEEEEEGKEGAEDAKKEAGKEAERSESKRDAEGDVVLPDAAAAGDGEAKAKESAPAAANPESGKDGESQGG